MTFKGTELLCSKHEGDDPGYTDERCPICVRDERITALKEELTDITVCLDGLSVREAVEKIAADRERIAALDAWFKQHQRTMPWDVQQSFLAARAALAEEG